MVLALITAMSLCALIHAQGAANGTSGSGAVEMRNCTDLLCSDNCSETEEGPICYCPTGYMLYQDMVTCQPCPGGLYGVGCSNQCNCSSGGNTCDRVSGECVCNGCYTGSQCQDDAGYDCFVQFLGMEDKSVGNLRTLYGSLGYPITPMDTIGALVSDGILLTSMNLISNEQIEYIDRSSVGQGPLIKLTFTVNKSFNRPEADRALAALSDRIKLGEIRATYILQDFTDEALVTINAGVKEDPI